MANKTGAFCEILNMTTTTENGEILVYGGEKLEFLQRVYDEAVAAGETPQDPVIHLEVVEATELMDILNMTTTEELAMLADYDMQSYEEDAAAAPSTAPLASPETRRHSRRQLLRLGMHGGMAGGGLRRGNMGRGIGRGVGGGFGRYGGVGSNFGRRNVGMGANQILASNFYGSQGRSMGGQSAYFIDDYGR